MTTVNRLLRTKEDANKVLELAKLDPLSFTGVTQVLYSNTHENASLKLLELDTHLLEVLSEGDTLSFRGNKHDPAVLCTKNRTYDLKAAETSNSLLVVSNMKFAEQTSLVNTNHQVVERCDVQGIFHTYFEVRECKPKLSRLRDLLEPSSFKGMEYEKNIEPETLYNWDRLQNEMQASEEELKQALNEYFIVPMNGYMRLISFEYEARALSFILDYVGENSWEFDEVDREDTYESLKELIPKTVFDVIFKKYTEPSIKTKKDGTSLYRLNEEKTCKFLAQLLLSASPVNDYVQFMEAWRIGVPEKMSVKKEYLNGIALIVPNKGKMKKDVIAFPEYKLPNNIKDRLKELFKVKEKWTIEEISPYLSNVATYKMDVKAILTKFTRSSTVNGVRYYSAKYGK
ncbi:sister chromatid cohesion protein DCC1 [Orussus abietinus]|uniref:sister chromatid cohesion protein DCC1 n=1 Tax=Orussus abietinus TaxID=222816 RepID=UPI00062620B1|nr:sister chromatid cohesion protein DCC1 [Orussus abietinus]